jgi:hypothetical protein
VACTRHRPETLLETAHAGAHHLSHVGSGPRARRVVVQLLDQHLDGSRLSTPTHLPVTARLDEAGHDGPGELAPH